jgi:hypothetical protein
MGTLIIFSNQKIDKNGNSYNTFKPKNPQTNEKNSISSLYL